MIEDFQLRGYRPGDLDAMYRLDMACFEPVFRFSRSAMRGFAEAPEAVTLLAEANGGLAGFVIAEVADRAGYIVTIDVGVEWRGKGLARRLMQDLESETRRAGAEVLLLHVYVQNGPAISLYERLGYETTGVSHDFYGTGLHALTYQKSL